MENKETLLTGLNSLLKEKQKEIESIKTLINSLSNEITYERIKSDAKKPRHKHGEIMAHINIILGDTDDPLRVAEIVSRLKHRQGIELTKSGLNQITNLLKKMEREGIAESYKEKGKMTVWMKK